MSEETTYRLQEALPILDVHASLHELAVRRTSVLVVEDEEDQNHVLASELRKAGFRVTSSLDASPVSSNGRALASFFAPDVVLLDLALPGAGDSELFETLRQVLVPGDVPIIVLATEAAAPIASGSRQRLGAECAALGATTCLVKPVDSLVLAETIRELVALRSGARTGAGTLAAPRGSLHSA